MKKCTSCTKDLPDAALHCVFCGAKQGPAPAVQQSNLAKTVMGYSAQEMIQQIRQQGIPAGTPGVNQMPQAPAPAPMPAAPAPAPQPAPQQYTPPPASPAMVAPTMYEMPPPRIPQAAPPPAAPQPAPRPAPEIAATMAPGLLPTMAPGAQMSPFAKPAEPAHAPPPASGLGGGGVLTGPSPVVSPLPASGPQPAPTPFAAPKPAPAPAPAPAPVVKRSGAATISSPDPLSGTLRVMLLVFGLFFVGAFVTPVRTEPSMVFMWDGIIDNESMFERISIILIALGAVTGLLLALVPAPTVIRGLVAGVIGTGAILMPILALVTGDGFDDLLQFLVVDVFSTFGIVLAIAGLFWRSGYHGSIGARLFATIGAGLIIMTLVLPVGEGDGPLLDAIKHIGDAEGAAGMFRAIYPMIEMALAVAALLVWVPGGGGLSRAVALAIVFVPVILYFVERLLGDGFADALSKAPNKTLFAWVEYLGFPAFAGFGFGACFGKASAG